MTIEPLISGCVSFLFPQKDEDGRERERENKVHKKGICQRKAWNVKETGICKILFFLVYNFINARTKLLYLYLKCSIFIQFVL